MKTELLNASDPQTIERAAALLQAGELVVFPTDTLYGLGANPYDDAAVEALYRVKDRSYEKGIPILLAGVADIGRVARDVSTAAQELLERFWPGPLTLIVPRQDTLASNISPNENIAVRIPDDEVAQAIIRAAGGALATTSANRSGEPPARHAAEALQALQGQVAAVVDGGPVVVGMPSTIVDCTGPLPVVLRPGHVSASDVTRLTGLALGESSVVRAPGTLASHYAPTATVRIVDEDALAAVPADDATTGVLALAAITTPVGLVRLSAPIDAAEYARVLYAALREADALGLARVLAVPPSADGVGAAVIDRLQRAAAGS